MKVVKGSFTQSGQFQVIIGNTVADFYNDFIKVAGIEGVSKDVVKQAAKKNQNVLQRVIIALAEIFAPLIPAIITGGLILGFRNCIDSIYLFENGTKTLCDISQFWAGIDSFLWLIGEAVFHMLPVGICWSVTKKMGTTQMLGIVLGLTLVSGQLLNAYAVAGTAAAEIPKWNFGGFQVNMIGYQGQVIPAILAAFTLVYLEKFFRKITPQVISMIVVPFFSLLLSVMAAHFVLGPVGWKIGAAVSAVVFAGITGTFKIVFGAVFGVIYAPLVITGLHHMSNAIDLQLIADYGGTMLWPMIALSNIAQGSAVLGMIWLQRKDPQAQEVNIPACISCYLGVTEPAIFGVNLKRGFPFVCGMIGSGLAAIICVATGTTANAIGVGGIPGILSIQPAFVGSFAICMVIAFGVSFLLTAIVGKKKLAIDVNETAKLAEIAAGTGASVAAGVMASVMEEREACEKGGNGTLTAFLTGKAIPLVDVGDGVFSAGVLGGGMAIIPESETLYAPADAQVAALMPESRHACGLRLENGMADLEELVSQSEKRGMGIMLDMVFNHTSTFHPWFQKALAGDEKYQKYYIFREGAPDRAPTNWQSKFGGPAWEYVPGLKKWYLRLYDVTQADLNWDNPEVREELKEILRFWKGKGIKGFRFDVINVASKPEVMEDDFEGDGRRFYSDGPHIHEYLKELVRDTGIEDFVTVGEMSSTSLAHCIRYSAPEEKELSMCFNFHHLKVDYKDGDKWALMGTDYRRLRELFVEWQEGMQKGGGWSALFWCNHDQPRIVSRMGDEQAYWKESAKMLAGMIHFMRGTPYIYQGEEIGMLNAHFSSIEKYRDVESLNYYELLLKKGKTKEEALEILGARSRDNSRTPMQWNGERYGGFSAAEPWLSMGAGFRKEITVEAQEKDRDSILAFYKKLIAVRKQCPVIAEGDIRFLETGTDMVLGYKRALGAQEILVFCNLGREKQRIKIEEEWKDYKTLLGNYGCEGMSEGVFTMKPYEFIALGKNVSI